MKTTCKIATAVVAMGLSGAVLAATTDNIPYLYIYGNYGNPVTAAQVIPGSINATTENTEIGLPENYNIVIGDKNAGLITANNGKKEGQLGVKLSYSVTTSSQGKITCPVDVVTTIGSQPTATLDPKASNMCTPLFNPIYSIGKDDSPVVTINWVI